MKTQAKSIKFGEMTRTRVVGETFLAMDNETGTSSSPVITSRFTKFEFYDFVMFRVKFDE